MPRGPACVMNSGEHVLQEAETASGELRGKRPLVTMGYSELGRIKRGDDRMNWGPILIAVVPAIFAAGASGYAALKAHDASTKTAQLETRTVELVENTRSGTDYDLRRAERILSMAQQAHDESPEKSIAAWSKHYSTLYDCVNFNWNSSSDTPSADVDGNLCDELSGN